MLIRVSPRLHEAIPTIEKEFKRVYRVAKRLDPDIGRVTPLYVSARCSRHLDYTSGHAFPETFSRLRSGEFIAHPPGRITLSIGEIAYEVDRLSLYAHELRHIGQFYRGWALTGRLSAEHLGREAELDAREFEEKVLNRI